MQDEIRKKWFQIKSYINTKYKLVNYYNVRLEEGTDIAEILHAIMAKMDSKPFQLAIEPGYILKRTTQEDRRYDNMKYIWINAGVRSIILRVRDTWRCQSYIYLLD